MQNKILKKLENMTNFSFEFKQKGYKARKDILLKLKDNIKKYEKDILLALKKDLSKSETEGYMTEVGGVYEEINFMLKNVKKLSKTKKVHTPLSQFPSKSKIIPCPYGKVLIISPWNYPFLLSFSPLVDAVASGNCVVLKPSKLTSNVTDVMNKIISETFSPSHVFLVKSSEGISTFLLEQKFDYIFYTGGKRIGKIVMQKASENLTPVTLELGGKSPCIVDDTANIKLSAKRIVFGKGLNAGQTCVAPDYILCDEKIKDELVTSLKEEFESQYKDAILDDNYPKIISKEHFKRVRGLIDKDKILYGGEANEESFKIQPTILKSNFDDKVMQEEIFGPILPIISYKNLDDAIRRINEREKPLALYIFSTSKENQNKILLSCDFGGGCINDTVVHLINSSLPFGGVGESGIGSYHGVKGFETFTHYKSVLSKSSKVDIPFRYRPYNKKQDKTIRKFLK